MSVPLLVSLVLLTSAPGFQLSWDPVTTNIDGTPCVDLAGYRLYWSTRSMLGLADPATARLDSLVQTKEVPATLTMTGLDALTLGQVYYFRLTAFDSTGHESGFSEEVVGQYRQWQSALDSLTARIVLLERWNSTLRQQVIFMDKRQVQQALALDRLLRRIIILENKTP